MKEDFPGIILEGENSVLFLQVSRDMLSMLRYTMMGSSERVSKQFSYFKTEKDAFDLPKTKEDCLDLHKLAQVFAHSALLNTVKASEVMIQKMGEGHDPKKVFDTMLGSRLWDMGKLHGIYSIVNNAVHRIQSYKDGLLKEVITKLFVYFLLDIADEHANLLVRT